jgi:hypothetical protein
MSSFSGGAGSDGGELRVRTDEIKSYRIERVSSFLTYEARAFILNANTSSPVWQIKRIITNNGETYWEWANSGAYNASWDDRNNEALWPGAIVLSNAYSTQFDGVNDYINFGNELNSFDVANQWSMSFWLKVDNYAVNRCFYSKINTGNNDGLVLQITSAGKVNITAETPSQSTGYTGLITVPTQTWTHVVITYSGGSNLNNFRLYVDATLDAIPAASGYTASMYAGQNAILGSRGGTGASFFSGNIDEVTFWSKALTAAEVSELYNSGAPQSPLNHSQSNYCAHWWRLGDSDVYPTVVDTVSSINGTMTNMSASAFVEDIP